MITANQYFLRQLANDTEEARESFFKTQAKWLDYPQWYRAIEKAKTKALDAKDIDMHSKLMATKAHLEMFDPAHH